MSRVYHSDSFLEVRRNSTPLDLNFKANLNDSSYLKDIQRQIARGIRMYLIKGFVGISERENNRIKGDPRHANLWKGIVLLLFILIMSSVFGSSECQQVQEQRVQRACLSEYMSKGCNAKNGTATYQRAKECNSLEKCFENPKRFVHEKEAEYWNRFIQDSFFFFKQINTSIWWITITLLIILIVFGKLIKAF